MHSQMQYPGSVVHIPAVVPSGTVQRSANDAKARRLKSVLRGIGFSQLVMGLISSVLSATLLVDVYGDVQRRYPFFMYKEYLESRFSVNFGEGLWCGVWIVAAGALGIACGKKTVTQRLIECYMVFSAFAALLSMTMFGVAVYMTRIYNPKYNDIYTLGFGLESAIAAIGFTSAFICITSAVLCCCWSSHIAVRPRRSNRCGQGSQTPDEATPRHVYITNGAEASPRQTGYIFPAPVEFPGIPRALPVLPESHLSAATNLHTNHAVSYQNIASPNAGHMNPAYGEGAPPS